VAVTKEQSAVAPSVRNERVLADRASEAREAVARGDATPQGVRSWGVLILAILAVVYTLYFAREIILPIVLAIVLKLLLGPAMRLLHERLRVPQSLAALLLILVVFGAIGAVGFAISLPASGWIERLPQTLPLLQEKLALLREPLDYIQNALKEFEHVTSTAGPGAGGGQSVTVNQGSGIAGHLATGTANMLGRFFTTMVLLFFLLASGDRLLRGFVEVLPRFSDKRQAVEIASEIETNITGYLLTITMMNALVGVATGLAMWACGLGTPLLWGAAAFLLNYIPILGPMVGIAMFFAAGVLSFDWPWYALAPAGIYLLIHVVEGETVTPMLLARRFTLNPVLVIGSLFFWHSVWGIPGAFLAVPLLAMLKILADRIEPLKPIGHIIGA
jgi:predicted PurR-regulated permease PerM